MSSFTPSGPLTTPVLFLVFNRPETTARVFEAIRQARPPRLYVAADGAREGREGEAERTADVRRIATAVDWPCEVRTLFRDRNLGCRDAVSRAITWFFENEEEGIILEDDCLPAQSFFWFCEAMLERYCDDMRIGQVSGLMRFAQQAPSDYSYFFSRFGPIWGWATWRRAWTNYDVDVAPEVQRNMPDIIETVTFDPFERARRLDIMQRIVERRLDTWDYQWGMAKYASHQLSIIPRVNMVQNIGLDGGTHQTDSAENRELVAHELDFPLRHPPLVYPQIAYDRRFSAMTRSKTLTQRAWRRLRRLVPG
ncbi:hypothetical protein [Roseinatronobacter sp.]|uniref:hypothetical protein n=1 Tax=Roseinatronobacter sp. TaxID=1945755 RepID=UPI0025CBCAA5|nr:hypothetical protein [Roseibaca sp.]